MFRLMLGKNVTRKSFDSLASKFSRNMSTIHSQPQVEQSRPRPEQMEVTICGCINLNPVVSERAITLNVLTHDANDEFSCKHRIVLMKRSMIDYFGNRLTTGQRIYVNGTMRYFEFVGEDEKRRKSGFISPNKLRICENLADENQSKLVSDINEVKFFGRVTGRPQNTEASTFLNVATHFFDRNEQLYQPNYHQLIVRKDDHLHDVVNNINVGSQLSVHGQMVSFISPTNDGRKKLLYYIKPNKLILSQENPRQGAQNDALDDLYSRLSMEELPGPIIDSTNELMNVFARFCSPKCKESVIEILGEKSGKQLTVFRENGDREFAKTIVVGIFDCKNPTWSGLYSDKPKTHKPLMVIQLDIE